MRMAQYRWVPGQNFRSFRRESSVQLAAPGRSPKGTPYRCHNRISWYSGAIHDSIARPESIITMAGSHYGSIVPTIRRIGPYRLYFYSSNGVEPPHVHVERDANTAKFWLEPVRVASSSGFRPVELRRLRAMIEQLKEELLEGWHEHFGP